MKALPPTRRRVMQAGVAGLFAAVVPSLGGCALPVIPKLPKPEPEEAIAWVHHLDGRTTLLIPRVEMGQKILTALKQIVCLELGVAWDSADARLHGTADIPRVRATMGGESVKDFAAPLTQACATLRDALDRGPAQGSLTVKARPLTELRSLRPSGLQHAERRMPLEAPGPRQLVHTQVSRTSAWGGRHPRTRALRVATLLAARCGQR